MSNQVRSQVISSLTLPVAVTAGVPLVLGLFYGLDNPVWHDDGIPFWERIGFGLIFLTTGLVLVTSTIRLFATIGQGTLAPWSPPQKLVVEGPYRHVRNPMISGVVCILAAEAIIFGGQAFWLWMLLFLAANIIYIPWSEEKGLAERFGDEYDEYKKNVPSWIPRLTPWNKNN